MSNLSDIGNLMYLDLAIIEPGEIAKTSAYLIKATAKELSNTDDSRNWIPLVVKEIAEDRYQVIGNSFIYSVAEAAGLEKVWCIIADSSEKTAKVTKILAGEEIPKINLATASRDEIKAALEYLVEQPATVLKGVKIAIATNRIDEAPRKDWKDLKPITKLNCGITAGTKIKALEKVFYLTPEPKPASKLKPELKPLNVKKIDNDKDLSKLNITELKKIAKERKLSGYGKFKKSQLIELLTQSI